MKKAARRVDECLIARRTGLAQRVRGRVHEPMGERVGKERHGVGRRTPCCQQTQRLIEGFGADVFRRGPQFADRRYDLLATQARHEAADFFLDENASFARLVFPRLQILRDEALQIVDRVEIDVLEITDLGLDVAWHGDVDHEHGFASASLECHSHVRGLDDGLGACRRGDDDVRFRQMAGKRIERDGRCVELRGEQLRAVEAAIGDDHPLDALRLQVPGSQRDRLAGTDQEGRMLLETREDLSGEADGRVRDGDRVGADPGLCSDPFGDREGGLKETIEHRSDRSVLLGCPIRVLELPQDLGFAEDHRVESGGDGEGVRDRSIVLMQVQTVPDRQPGGVVFGEPAREIRRGVRDAVDFRAVAGRDDDVFVRPTVRQRAQGRRQLDGIKNNLFTDLERGRAMVDSDDDERHVSRSPFRTLGLSWTDSRRASGAEALGYSARMKLARLLRVVGLWAVLVAGPAAAGALRAPAPLVDAAVERGEYPRAVELERQHAARTADRAAYEQAAKLAFDLTQDRALERLSKEWLALEPESEAARRFHAIALLELDRRDEAVEDLERLVGGGGKAPADSFSSLGESLAELRNAPGVADVMAKLADRHPESADADLAAGMLLLAAEQSERALRFARKAVSLAPASRSARWLEARALVVGGDCDAGLQAARTLAMDRREGDRLTQGWLMVACGRGAEAEAEFTDLLKVPALRVRAIEALAARDLDLHRDDAAQRRYLELGNESAASNEAYWGLAVLADRAQDYPRAVGLYRHIVSGSRAVAAQLRAYVLALGHVDLDYADRSLDEILFMAPDLRVAITAGRVEVLTQRAKADAALALSDRALRAYPDRIELRYARAMALDGLGRSDDALRALEGVLEQRPDDPIAQNAYGYSLADKGRDLPRAERLIRSALAMRPDSAAIKDSLGWVLHRRGHSVEALAYLRAAYKVDPEPEVATHLGEALWATGAHAEAEALWRSALERSPDDHHLRASIERHLGSKP